MHQKEPPITLSRDELYEQVWQKPMTKLATQYGISDNGLAKICRKLKVPYPPRGYWAKKTHGKKVAVTPLPPISKGVLNKAIIRPTPPPDPDIKNIREEIEILASDLPAIVVPARLGIPHPIIAKQLVKHEQEKQAAKLDRSGWHRPPEPFTSVERRCHRILDALFKALTKQGASISEGSGSEFHAQINGERVDFRLIEKSKRVRRPLTADEKRWRSSGDSDWKNELQPTGFLSFKITNYFERIFPREWIETESAPMETMLSSVIATIMAAIPGMVERSAQRAEEARLYAIAERERYEREQQRKLDANRWRRFVEFAQQQQDTQRAAILLASIKSAEFDPNHMIENVSIAQWIAWAEKQLKQADPLHHGIPAIFEAIAKVHTWTYRE